MSEYELMYLVDPSLEEEARNDVDAAIDAFVAAQGATVNYASPSARRRLGYPILKQHMAFVRTLQLELAPDRVADVRAACKKQAGVLRLSILATPRREEVTLAALDVAKKQQVAPAQAAVATKKPAKKMSEAEIEEKIEKALEDEEVK